MPSIEPLIPISRKALLLPTDLITPTEAISTVSRQVLILTTEDLIWSTDTVSIISRQALLSPTDEIDTTIRSQEVEEDSSECQTRASPSPLTVPINSRIVKANKKERQSKNRNTKNGIHGALGNHSQFLSDDGFMNEEKLSEPSSNPSFSSM